MGLKTKIRFRLEERRAEEWASGLETKSKNAGNVYFPPVEDFFLLYQEFGTP